MRTAPNAARDGKKRERVVVAGKEKKEGASSWKPEAGSVATQTNSVREGTQVREDYPGLPLGSRLTGRATASAGAPGVRFPPCTFLVPERFRAYLSVRRSRHRSPCCIASCTLSFTTGY
ncbi:hypothetical protein MRX96_025937 [Rhipicephalus microplus]